MYKKIFALVIFATLTSCGHESKKSPQTPSEEELESYKKLELTELIFFNKAEDPLTKKVITAIKIEFTYPVDEHELKSHLRILSNHPSEGTNVEFTMSSMENNGFLLTPSTEFSVGEMVDVKFDDSLKAINGKPFRRLIITPLPWPKEGETGGFGLIL